VDDESMDRETPESVEHGSVRRRGADSLPLRNSLCDEVRAQRLHEPSPNKVPDMPENLSC
jgi:hypothetical protein